MAYGGHSPQFQTQNHDLFSASDLFQDLEESGADASLRVYGATGGSMPIQRPKLAHEGETDGIPMHDFQAEGHKDPLILTQSQRAAAYITTARPSQSLQSLNSVSDMTEVSVLSYNQYDSWVHHPKVRENWRLVVGAGILMVLGIVLIIAGIGIAVSPATGYHCIVIIIIGALCLIPGGYHFIYIYCAAIGRPGFDFSNLPALR
ncbi:transmembrane protein 134-like [Babylonia areolata]|uniref:transmembrane protein 134-like n=1 Tax=Babylonia areolata TaxID=304850 RepID=UPI003FD6319A